LSFKHNYDYFIENHSFTNEIDIPSGEYSYDEIGLKLTTPQNKKLGLEIKIEGGSFYDARYKSLGVEPRWNPSAHFEIMAAYEFRHLNFKERNQILKSHILRLRALYMLNTKFSVAAFIQYNNDLDLFISNLKIRYNPKEGNDLYLVFNEVLNSNSEKSNLLYPLLNTEVFALKYTYTFKIDQ